MSIAPQMMTSARTGTGADDWNTDPGSLELVRRVGRIDYDPCSNPASLVAADLEHSLEGGHDGLAADWSLYVKHGGLVFENNPYSQQKLWTAKTIEQAAKGVSIIMLIPARTDTRAWHDLKGVADVIAFRKGRITFWQNGAPAPAPAPFPSAFIGINVPVQRFRAAFEDIAMVVCP